MFIYCMDNFFFRGSPCFKLTVDEAVDLITSASCLENLTFESVQGDDGGCNYPSQAVFQTCFIDASLIVALSKQMDLSKNTSLRNIPFDGVHNLTRGRATLLLLNFSNCSPLIRKCGSKYFSLPCQFAKSLHSRYPFLEPATI